MYSLLENGVIGLKPDTIYKFNNKYVKTIDLLKNTTWTKKFINRNTGVLENNTSYPNAMCSDFIEVDTDIPYITNLGYNTRIRLYDKDYNYIYVKNPLIGSKYINDFISDEVKYVRILDLSGKTDYYFKPNTNIKLPNQLYNTISSVKNVKYIVKHFAKVTLDGTENWTIRKYVDNGYIKFDCSKTSSDKTFFKDYRNTKYKMVLLDNPLKLNNEYLDNDTPTKSWISGRVNGTGWIICVPAETIKDIDSLKTYLANNNITFYAQLYETQYIPYDTRELSYNDTSIKDTITNENGKLYYNKVVDKYILNGTENWRAQTDKTNTSVFAMSDFLSFIPISQSLKSEWCSLYCNLLKNGTDQTIEENQGDVEKFVVQATTMYFAVSKTKVADFVTQDFKDWLKINRPILFYPTTKTNKVKIR